MNNIPIRVWKAVRGSPGLVFSCIAVGAGIAHLLRHHFRWSDSVAVAIALGICVVLLPVSLRFETHKRRAAGMAFSVSALLLIGFWYHFRTEFGWFDWNVIHFHIVAGMDSSRAVWDAVARSRNALLGFGLVILGLTGISARLGLGWRSDVALATVLLTANPAVWQLADILNPAASAVRSELSRQYVQPVLTEKQSEQRNFLHIFLESTERTFLMKPELARVMAPLAAIEAHGFAAIGMQQIAHTRWSVAGMTAAFCGVPLFPVGYTTVNGAVGLGAFLPNAICIGDLLAPRGYELTFIIGASSAFGGIDKLYLGHGFKRIIDGSEILAAYPGHASDWGAHDSAVLATVLSTLRNLQKRDVPFGLVVETIGGHGPDGYVSPECTHGKIIAGGLEGILQAIACTNSLVARMLESAEQEGLLANTVVVLQSDHISLERELFRDLAIEDRRLFFAISGEGIPAGVAVRPSSPVDVFPTLLEAIGLPPADRKAGLGVSLLSDTPTLLEVNGSGRFDQIIYYDRTLGRRLWAY